MEGAPRTGAQKNVGRYVAIFWRQKVTIVLCVLIAVGGMLIVDTLRSPVYSASTKVELSSSKAITTTTAATDQIVLTSQPVLNAARQILGLPMPSCSASQFGTTTIMIVNCRASDPNVAANAANAIVQGYNKVMQQNAISRAAFTAELVSAKLKSTQAQVDLLLISLSHAGGPNTTLGGLINKQLSAAYAKQYVLQQQLTALEAPIFVDSQFATVLQKATPNDKPLSPKPLNDALIAGLVGLALGLTIAILRETLDDKIHSRADVEEIAIGRPVIGLIPAIGEWHDQKTPLLIAAEQPTSPSAEAFRALRTSLQFMSLDEPLKTLLVTSPAAADGKTTVSADLAYTIASAGQQIILVGCDLRKPRIHEFFGVSNEVGFTSVLLGEIELDEAIVDVPGNPYLKVLPAGPVPPNPSELLSGRRAEQVFDALKQRCDLVIMDSPPLLAVSDSAVLAAKCDGVMLVTAAGISTKRDMSRAIDVLRQVDAALVGITLNRAPLADSPGYGYGYGYGYGHEVPTSRRGSNGAGTGTGATATATNGASSNGGAAGVVGLAPVSSEAHAD